MLQSIRILKKAGIKLGEKIAIKMVEKIPGKVLISINKKIGFRLITKFGNTGIVNLGKLVPGVGAVVGGGLDYLETKNYCRKEHINGFLKIILTKK